MSFHWDNSYLTLPEVFYKKHPIEPWSNPHVLVGNDALMKALGVNPASDKELLEVLSGNVSENSLPYAHAYAGHQFGHFTMLGDGRAVHMGEHITPQGKRFDVQLKGAGKTAFSRGGDGRATLRSMLREYLISEAMHGLGIESSRSLCVIETGNEVFRERVHAGAVLARVMKSHIRVGTFEYARYYCETSDLEALFHYTLNRLYPTLQSSSSPVEDLFMEVMRHQIDTVCHWMRVGFIHGVMNTDNMTISGETIDYGPCAFMDAFDPATVFSSIDHNGRYAFGNQPNIGQWNLARLAETLLPLFSTDKDESVAIATEVLMDFPKQYQALWDAGMSKKLGLKNAPADLVNDLLQMLHTQSVDYTQFFRSLSSVTNGDASAARNSFINIEQYDAWESRWKELISRESQSSADVATSMDLVNPIYIARNHLVEEALAAATEGDLNPTLTLLEVLQQPFNERPGFERFAQPAPSEYKNYQTFCGT